MATRFPIGIQDFEYLRREGYAYVDKTDLIYDLVDQGKYYFLSRPRRFGKSLLTSTLHAYFAGKQDLFDGLAISRLEKKWTSYAVLHLDLSSDHYNSVEKLQCVLSSAIDVWAEGYGVAAVGDTISLKLKDAIRKVNRVTENYVVILVDEYDKPLIDNIDDPELQTQLRNELSSFYANLKSMDHYIRFGFLTGVSRFSHLNIFSSVNNLQDISLTRKYNNICGITRAEMLHYFDSDIEAMAAECGLSKDQTICRLEEMYDGYHFAPATDGLFNPYTLITALQAREFLMRWAESGTPTFLTNLAKSGRLNLAELQHLSVDISVIMNTDPTLQTPESFLLQTGYLTIKDYDKTTDSYTIGFPNKMTESIATQKWANKSCFLISRKFNY